jgi:aryl-alcohol dehydrogenase-like predicted oxidoreductase
MRYRLLGASGLRVSQLFLGAMTFGERAGTGTPTEECARMLDAYADAGGNVIDTAVNYQGGASEEVLGQLLGGRRDRFILASKYTITRDGTDPNAAGAHRKNLRHSLETSLRRLRTDYLDLYWVHVYDRRTPLEETMRALDDQVRAGKILYAGISDAPAWVVARANTLAELRGWSPFIGLQVPYSLLQRDIETRADADGRSARPEHCGLGTIGRRHAVGQVHRGRPANRADPPGRGVDRGPGADSGRAGHRDCR